MGYFQSFEGVAFQIELLFFVDAPRARVKINTQEQTDTNRILREFMWRLHEDPGLPPGNPPPNFIPLSLEKPTRLMGCSEIGIGDRRPHLIAE